MCMSIIESEILLKKNEKVPPMPIKILTINQLILHLY